MKKLEKQSFAEKSLIHQRDIITSRWEILFVLFTVVLAGLIGYVLGDLLFPPELKVLSADGKTVVTLFSKGITVFFKLFFTLFLGLLGAFSSAYFFEHYVRKAKIDEIGRSLITVLDRLENISEHVAFHTEDDTIEKNVIDLLRRKTGGAMWIAARFISKQLSKSFSMLKFEIDGDDYSKFSEKLYQECANSIYLTSPFTPVEWFRQLYPDHADQVIERINKGEDIEKDFGIPAHVKSVISAGAKTKKRIVILPSGNWVSLIAQEKLLEKFLDLNKGIDTRFVVREKLCEKYDFASKDEFDFSRYDYAIFDNEILLKWERPSKSNENRPILLLDLKNGQTDEKYKKIKEDIFKFDEGQYIKGQEVLDMIIAEKRNLKDRVKEKQDLPHKLAYFAAGATSWVTISDDSLYNLGKREILTLQRFLEQIFEKDKTLWNILHIGPGNGKEIPAIVDILGPNLIERYALVDISPELLQMAESFGRKNYEKINFVSYVRDVTKEQISPIADGLKKNGAPNNLIILVGNGAILSNAPVFEILKQSMGPQDRLLITLETYSEDRKEEILKEYKLPSVTRLLVEPLSLVGIDVDGAQKNLLKFEYNSPQSLVEVYFLFKDWINTHQERREEFDRFPECFRVFASLRPTPEKLRELLTMHGFKIEKLEPFMQYFCCGVLCSISDK